MNLKIKTMLVALPLIAAPMFIFPSGAEAGPLLDWIRNGCRRKSTPAPMIAQNTMGLQPGQCMQTCMKTCTRTVVNYVPQTCFRTEYKRVPVTQFRPVTTTDPCTGCTVTCMKPCTTFTMQAQRVPYTTFRPEYRTETFQVPVTTITNDCAMGNVAMPSAMPTDSCPTCIPSTTAPMMTPGTIMPGTIMPGTIQSAPSDGTYYEYPATSAPRGSQLQGGGSTFQSNIVPADTAPMLNPQSSTKPAIERLQTRDSNPSLPATYQQPTPAYYPGHSADANVRQEWNYSPVRLASHSKEINYVDERQVRYTSTLKPVVTERTDEVSSSETLNGWKVVK